jgi:sec-independent protein translocase protein TatB
MEILGVGVPEMLFIVLIALILLGPKEMIAASRTLGKVLRKFLTSPTWLAMRKTGEELQQLPTKLVREAGLEELRNEVQETANQIKPVNFKNTFDEAKIFNPAAGMISPPPPVKPASSPESDPPAEKPAAPPAEPASDSNQKTGS